MIGVTGLKLLRGPVGVVKPNICWKRNSNNRCECGYHKRGEGHLLGDHHKRAMVKAVAI